MALSPRDETKDGFEMQFGVNVLGHFLLTHLLLDIIIASGPSRIVHVSSIVHYYGSINQDDLMSERSYSKYGAYCQSKLANVIISNEFAKRLKGTGVTSNSLHPGAVTTELQRHANFFEKIFFLVCLQFFFKTPRSGAQTTLAVALDPELNNVTGKYFSDCKIKKEAKQAEDDVANLWLWNKCMELTGLNTLN